MDHIATLQNFKNSNHCMRDRYKTHNHSVLKKCLKLLDLQIQPVHNKDLISNEPSIVTVYSLVVMIMFTHSIWNTHNESPIFYYSVLGLCLKK